MTTKRPDFPPSPGPAGRLLRPFLLLSVLVGLLASGAASARAAMPAPEEILEVEALASADGVPAGGALDLAIRVRLEEGWHVNSNRPSYEFAVPTELAFDPLEGITLSDPVFPAPTAFLRVPGTEEETELFEGSFVVRLRLEASETASPGPRTLRGRIAYQGCNDETCLRPTEKPFELSFRILPQGAEARPLHGDLFGGGPAAPAASEARGRFFETGDVEGVVARRGLLVTLLLVFLGGLALNLTPCVYPLIPITISYFGGMSVKRKGSPLPSAVAYVLGICLMYSALGVGAALSGRMFGALLAHPVVLVAIAALMVALAASMFGLYEIRLPSALMNMGGTARTGVLGSLFMGLTMGIVAAPCIGPFVIGLLTYVATLGSPLKGFLLFFALSLGLGLPYLFLGIFSGRIAMLPRSGAWMVGVRKIFGWVLVIMAVYFLNPLMSPRVYHVVLSSTLVAAGLCLVILVPSEGENRLFHVIKSLVAVAMIMAGTWIVKPSGSAAEGLPFEPYSAAALSRAAEEGRPVVIDFYADWCIPCREFEAVTFRDASVRAWSDRFVFLKADVTVENDETRSWKEAWDVRGVPTLLFIGPDGRERRELRLTGFERPERFVKRLERAAAGD